MLWTNSFETVEDVPDECFQNRKKIFAFVERIVDGDTIRVSHYPCYSVWRQRPRPLLNRSIGEFTLKIRLYGIDSPKTKSGKSPYGAQEAKDLTCSFLLHKMVAVTLLRKDQYGRAVCRVETMNSPFGVLLACIPGCGGNDMSLELARAGWAELYTGGGAMYCGNRDLLERLIREAQEKQLGIWAAAEKQHVQRVASPLLETASPREGTAARKRGEAVPAFAATLT